MVRILFQDCVIEGIYHFRDLIDVFSLLKIAQAGNFFYI